MRSARKKSTWSSRQDRSRPVSSSMRRIRYRTVFTWTYMRAAHAFQELEQGGQQLGAVLLVVGQQRAEQPVPERAQHAARHAGQQKLVRGDLVAGHHADGRHRGGGGGRADRGEPSG